jgi:hypothetical protein
VPRSGSTILDGYNQERTKAFVWYCWRMVGRGKPRSRNHTTRQRRIPQHAPPWRRQLEFPDMFSLCLPDEGPTP